MRLDPQIRFDAWAVRPALRADRPAEGAAASGVQASEARRDRVVCGSLSAERPEHEAGAATYAYWRYLQEANQEARACARKGPREVQHGARVWASGERRGDWPRISDAPAPRARGGVIRAYEERPAVRPGSIVDVFA